MILSSLLLQKQEEQKKRIDGLDAIKQALLSTTTGSDDAKRSSHEAQLQNEAAPLVVATNKAKPKLVAEEVEHMSLILQHPAYKANPFETMQEHLRNTLAASKAQQEEISKQRTQQERQKVQEKQRLKKERMEGVRKKKNKKKYKPRRTN